MRSACRTTKATDTHSEYVMLIAFPRQQWLRERASKLRYTYIAFVVKFGIGLDVSGHLHSSVAVSETNNLIGD